MNPTILIIFAAALIYFALGIDYANMLHRHWPQFRRATHRYPSVHALTIMFWPAIFITFITMCMIEPLTKSRKDDWQETESQVK